MPQAGEPDLVTRLRTGRVDTFVELVKAHYQAVYHWLFHLTLDVHQAEDLTQETFAVAWEKLESFEGRSSVKTWLHRIAYTRFLDSQRAARCAARNARQLARPRDSTLGPLDDLVADDEAKQLRCAMHSLSETDRTVLILHYLQDLSYREMAQVLDEPPGTVKWRTSVALDRLRALLPDEDPDHDVSKPTRSGRTI
jgi:RNA polymerase sigma-70 factor (ECF subfamily)